MSDREPMLDMFLFETAEMTEQLEQIIIDSEKTKEFQEADINEIFRIMHTIKGSSGMMMFENIAKLAHTIEDLFYFIRESKPKNIDYSTLTDLVLEGNDFIKGEVDKIDNDREADGDFTKFVEEINKFLSELKGKNGIETQQTETEGTKAKQQKYYLTNDKISKTAKTYSAQLFFEENCEMENIRGFSVLHKLKNIAEVISYDPEDIIENNDSSEVIREQGFSIIFKSNEDIEKINSVLMETVFISKLDIIEINENIELTNKADVKIEISKSEDIKAEKSAPKANHKQSLISVDVHKLDMLMDLVGELVISEAMVTKNKELEGLSLDNFYKAARQHKKRLLDLQDVVMSIRMVSLAPTLNKMNRLVRDMCKKLDKEADLELIGQDTEVDKNIIEHIGDPLMHIVRNSMDHGIETPKERVEAGKEGKGKIIIEAKNAGGEALITIKDDGNGLDKDKILKKAGEHGLLDGRELSDREIYSLIFLPGFSTNDDVTEYSGRGVGMDVVVKEIEKIRGNVAAYSVQGKGTTITIKIPLTLAIIDGMTIRVGRSTFTIPITAIKESIIVKKEDIINDLDNKEMILIRGKCYSILRLHKLYEIETDIENIEDGIVVMVEDEGKQKCIFADELIGEQQVVIKALPEYIKKVNGVSGCTLLGDGSISLILDVSKIVNL